MMELKLQADFKALSQIETELGMGIIALSQQLSEGQITLKQISVILAYTSSLSLQSIETLLVREGLIDIYEAVAGLFTRVLGKAEEHVPLRPTMLAMMKKYPD